MNTQLKTELTKTELKLLVVEDEALISLDLECILQDLGHQVLGVAGNVAKALALVEQYAQEADGAVLDVNLGGHSSAPVADALHSHGIPFVVASGYEQGELERLGFKEKGVNKPYSSQELANALQKLER
ncbi:MAG: response regulator [Pararhodobacter sp.]|nr:response regulator [Pararhodobacter sp.]